MLRLLINQSACKFVKNCVFKFNIKTCYKQLSGVKIGIVGITTPETAFLSSPGPNIKFLDPATSLQKAVRTLRRKEGVKFIIALTHIGYGADQELAGKVRRARAICSCAYDAKA